MSNEPKQKSSIPQLSGLLQAGSKVQKTSVKPRTGDKPDAERLWDAAMDMAVWGKDKPTAESSDFSPVGGKLLHRLEPVSTPDGEPSIEDKFRDAGVYGEAGGSVLTRSSAESHGEEDNA